MTDRELLEAAAKAAGIVLPHYLPALEGEDYWLREWNPLTDDGDALRLAVKLRIAIRLDDPDAASAGWSANQTGAPTHDGSGPWFWKEWIKGEAHNAGDPYAATRRAIVCAAAAMGRA
jgi:hypothetical protein